MVRHLLFPCAGAYAELISHGTYFQFVSMQASRIVAQLLLSGGAMVLRAAAQAYQQALASTHTHFQNVGARPCIPQDSSAF